MLYTQTLPNIIVLACRREVSPSEASGNSLVAAAAAAFRAKRHAVYMDPFHPTPSRKSQSCINCASLAGTSELTRY